MTISRYRDDAALSLSKISKHVKTIRKHRRNKSEQKEFLKAFEKDFLDSVYMIVAARNVGNDEEGALNRLKIVHYNSARLCLEDIVKRKTKSWRKFKGNKDLFVDVTISQEKYDQYVGQWNAATDILRKTKSYCDDDKIRSAGCFDGHDPCLFIWASHQDSGWYAVAVLVVSGGGSFRRYLAEGRSFPGDIWRGCPWLGCFLHDSVWSECAIPFADCLPAYIGSPVFSCGLCGCNPLGNTEALGRSCRASRDYGIWFESCGIYGNLVFFGAFL